MATSGTTTWTLNRNQVITGALRKLAVLASGGTPTSAQISDAGESLNAIIKAFHADGMPLWAITSYNFTTVAGTDTYTIGTGQTLNTPQPLKVIQALRASSGQPDIPMNIYNRYDFANLPNTTTTPTGTPVNLYYQPLRNSGVLKLWPIPSDSTTVITIHYQRPFEDMTASSDDFDFPAYWIQALIYNLAWSLSPEYGIPTNDRNQMAQEAKFWKDEALSYGTEEGSMYFQPDWSSNLSTG